ncbi:hypothetical protein JCM19992_14440 [Thermostilla marina]
MKGAKFDCSRDSRRAHEASDVPIRVDREAYENFCETIRADLSRLIAKHRSPRRIKRSESIIKPC